EQQTGEERDARRADQQNDDAEDDRAQSGLADALHLAEGVLLQLVGQLLHLLPGVAIDAPQPAVSGHRVPVTVDELGKAVTVMLAQLLMGGPQPGDARPYVGADIQHADLFEQPLYIGLAALELLPVAVQVGLIGAARQDVLPFLDLFPERQVGLVDLIGGGHRPFDQATVVAQLVCQNKYAGNGNQQHQRQASDQQGQTLQSQ